MRHYCLKMHGLTISLTPYVCCLVDPVTRLNQTWIEFIPNIGNKGASSLHAGWNPSKGRS